MQLKNPQPDMIFMHGSTSYRKTYKI